MLKNIAKALRPSRNAVQDALGVVDQLREQIAERNAALRQIADAPLPVEDGLAAFDAWAASAATAAVDAMHPGRFLSVDPRQRDLRLPTFAQRLADGAVVQDATRATEILLGLIVATSGPALRGIIEGQLSDLVAGRQTITAAERSTATDRARAELLELGLHEERAIRDLEAAGIPVMRRADADPRAVLADEASLPN